MIIALNQLARGRIIVCTSGTDDLVLILILECDFCEDGKFILCQACHTAPGVYCKDKEHFSSMTKHIEDDTQGSCPRVMRPYTPDSSLVCSRCFGATGVLYLRECGFNFCFA